MSDSVPATFLQLHPNVEFFIDENAAEELTRQPAVVGEQGGMERQAYPEGCHLALPEKWGSLS